MDTNLTNWEDLLTEGLDIINRILGTFLNIHESAVAGENSGKDYSKIFYDQITTYMQSSNDTFYSDARRLEDINRELIRKFGY